MDEDQVVVAASPATAQLAQIVKSYVALRDRKAALKKKFDQDTESLNAGMAKAESYFLGYMNLNGLTSLPTAEGTPYKSLQTSVTVADKVAYFGWLSEKPERFEEYLDIKANKTAVLAMREAENDIPPGLNYREENVCNVRR